MDLEMYLLLERKNLQEERARISARQSWYSAVDWDEQETKEAVERPKERDSEEQRQHSEAVTTASQSEIPIQQCSDEEETQKCPAARLVSTRCNRINREPIEGHANASETSSSKIVTMTENTNDSGFVAANQVKTDNVNGMNKMLGSEVALFDAGSGIEWTKSAKELVNRKEVQAEKENKHVEEKELAETGRSPRSDKDDMEQWVTDTFYSYFPGFSNEYQKRQRYLRERQREFQQNFLKHQHLNPPLSKHAAQRLKHNNTTTARLSNSNLNSNNNNATSTSNTTASHATDKTDLEIIVNNPNYVPLKHSGTAATRDSRPGTTRHKLLQDLRHTDLSPQLADDDDKQHVAEAEESARKKDYQRELMQQIEEKRRSIELLREKERLQDEVLTRRLQEQLKTIQLEENLEKERMRADKLRFDTEQNRLMREQMLAKLEQDAKLLDAAKSKKSFVKIKSTSLESESAFKNSASTEGNDSNKVYKYFSNSASHEYRRGKSLPADIELDLEIPGIRNVERECFHLSEKVCPMCDAPLKNYESCCLRCQKKLSLKLSARRKPADANGNEATECVENRATQHVKPKAGPEPEESDGCASKRSFALVCIKCERMYTLCPQCLAKNDVCRACHRKLNVCMNCRRTLCTFCLEEIASGRDTERGHINENELTANNNKSDTESERSFRVLTVNHSRHKDSDEAAERSSSPPLPSGRSSHAYADNVSYRQIQNNLQPDAMRPPYSMNIERNSIFHPDYEAKNTSLFQANDIFEQLPKLADKQLSFELDSSPAGDDQATLERIRKETDKRLSRYLKNYGDLAQQQSERSKSESRHRSTQTIPDGFARRDIVLQEDNHNLSMPLLREMPKMTRKESGNLMAKASANSQRKIDNLKRKWEIPAVQKFTISSSSPKVLTQVGAIRKQLQAERLFADNDTDEY